MSAALVSTCIPASRLISTLSAIASKRFKSSSATLVQLAVRKNELLGHVVIQNFISVIEIIMVSSTRMSLQQFETCISKLGTFGRFSAHYFVGSFRCLSVGRCDCFLAVF